MSTLVKNIKKTRLPTRRPKSAPWNWKKSAAKESFEAYEKILPPKLTEHFAPENEGNMEKEMPFWNLSFLGYMSIFGGGMHFGSQGISQHLPPLHWPAEACDQWNQGIYLASSFQSESNSKSDTVALSQKVTRNRTLPKRVWFLLERINFGICYF